MALDSFGKIAIVEIIFYVPVLCIAFFIALKHGFSKQQGWIFLFTFSLVRIIGAGLSIASKTDSNPSSNIVTAAAVLQGVGLSPLLLGTLGFVTKIAQYGLPSMNTFCHLVRIMLGGAVVLGIVGGSKSSPGHDQSTIDTGHTFSRVGGMLYLAAYACLFGVHVLLWRARERIPTHHRTLLSGVSLALLPLFVRIIYSLGSTFSSSSHSRWSPISGDLPLYFCMGVAIEYLVVLAYAIAGALSPLHKDEEAQTDAPIAYHAPTDELLEMGKRKDHRANAPSASSYVTF